MPRRNQATIRLLELNARVLRADRDVEETFQIAWKMFRMRRMVERRGDGYVVPPENRALVAYYANSIAHLLGPFERNIMLDRGLTHVS